MQAIADLLAKQWQAGLPLMLARALCAAAVTELLVWLVSLRLRKALMPAVRRAAERGATDLERRTAVIVRLPLRLTRATLYTVGALLILRVFGLRTGAEVLPVLVLVVVTALVIARGPLRDAVRGYLFVYDDTFGPGDQVSCGDLSGIVLAQQLRTTTLQLPDGREAVVRNADLRTVVNHSRSGTGSGTPEHVS